MKLLFVSLSALLIFTAGCKKSSDDPASVNPPTACNQNPAKVGSVYVIKAVATGQTFTQTATKDTMINGVKYLKFVTAFGSQTATSYLAVDANANVWQAIPQTADLPANQMIYFKLGQPVGTTWSYTHNSVSTPAQLKHKYTFTHTSVTDTIRVADKTYNNGTRVNIQYEMVYNGTVMNTATSTSTWFCGLGNGRSSSNGSPSSEIVSFTY